MAPRHSSRLFLSSEPGFLIVDIRALLVSEQPLSPKLKRWANKLDVEVRMIKSLRSQLSRHFRAREAQVAKCRSRSPRGLQNLILLKFISLSKSSNFGNRTESAESRALERIEPFGEE
jgi:hypothetical protein